MAKQIEISDWAYEKISSLMSEDDTAGSVISRLLANSTSQDALETQKSNNLNMNFHMAAVPDLTFTKIISAKLNGDKVKTTNWKGLRDAIIKLGVANGVNLEEVSSVHIVTGKKTDEGFEFYESMGLSIQGQSAKDSWKTCSDICFLMKATVEVLVQWRENKKAAYPGQKAKLFIP